MCCYPECFDIFPSLYCYFSFGPFENSYIVFNHMLTVRSEEMHNCLEELWFLPQPFPSL